MSRLRRNEEASSCRALDDLRKGEKRGAARGPPRVPRLSRRDVRQLVVDGPLSRRTRHDDGRYRPASRQRTARPHRCRGELRSIPRHASSHPSARRNTVPHSAFHGTPSAEPPVGVFGMAKSFAPWHRQYERSNVPFGQHDHPVVFSAGIRIVGIFHAPQASSIGRSIPGSSRPYDLLSRKLSMRPEIMLSTASSRPSCSPCRSRRSASRGQ